MVLITALCSHGCSREVFMHGSNIMCAQHEEGQRDVGVFPRGEWTQLINSVRFSCLIPRGMIQGFDQEQSRWKKSFISLREPVDLENISENIRIRIDVNHSETFIILYKTFYWWAEAFGRCWSAFGVIKGLNMYLHDIIHSFLLSHLQVSLTCIHIALCELTVKSETV